MIPESWVATSWALSARFPRRPPPERLAVAVVMAPVSSEMSGETAEALVNEPGSRAPIMSSAALFLSYVPRKLTDLRKNAVDGSFKCGEDVCDAVDLALLLLRLDSRKSRGSRKDANGGESDEIRGDAREQHCV